MIESPPSHDSIARVETSTGEFESRPLEPGGTMKVSIRRVEMERFSVVSPKRSWLRSKRRSAIPIWGSLPATKGARTFAALKDVVRRGLGKTELMLFMELDHGAILRKETGLDSPKIVRLVENAEALAVARDLDSKIERLRRESAE